MSDTVLIEEGVSPDAAQSPTPLSAVRLIDVLFVLGLLTLPLEVVQIGMAQPCQVWMLVALPIIALTQTVKLSSAERFMFFAFIVYATALTFITDYPRVKASEQILKFAVIYPGFYYVGRGFGAVYTRRPLPVGYVYLAVLLALEILVEHVRPPFLYQELDFAEGALHGTFKERNWISMYFFMLSYFIFEVRSKKGLGDLAVFMLLNAVVTDFSGSKTIIVGCGIVLLLRSNVSVLLKLPVIAAGAVLYWMFFRDALSGDEISVRIEDERGLAYAQSILMLSRNILGYGFGYVEGYFSQLSLTIIGLGAGDNSVFSVPIDLMIIAGLVGLAAWLVFFGGVGLGATAVLAPVAALSLLNPLHQSELVYFFIGMLVSGTMVRRPDLPQPRIAAEA